MAEHSAAITEQCYERRSKPSGNTDNSQLCDNLPLLRRFIANKVKPQHDVDDLLQETLSRTLDAAHQQHLENPMAYAYRVARNKIVDYWKEQANANDPLDEQMYTDNTSPELNHHQQQQLQIVQQTLQQMPALRREIFLRRRLDGLSRQALAEEFEISTEAVKKHLTRAMVSLTLALEKQQQPTVVALRGKRA